MSRTIKATEEFFVGSYGEVFKATYEVEDFKGMDAFNAFCKIYSIVPEPHEEDREVIEENIIEQIRFHGFKDQENNRESQGDAQYDDWFQNQ